MNIVMAMNMGGDDFIAKPFDLNVLTAKLQAILRRTYDFGSTEQVLECRGAVLNTSDASLTYQGEKLELTKNEYRILQTLYENLGKVVSRDTLMQRLWETDCFVDEYADSQCHEASQEAGWDRSAEFYRDTQGNGVFAGRRVKIQ